mgnify:CR=1 FL=1|jgi:hypothetical protein|tara:strand:+ start:1107 stop:1619 length:513 start_codon:yes stop_codon:yes gene_type:complete
MKGMGMKKKMTMAGGGMMRKKGMAGGGMMKKGYRAGGMPMTTDPKTGKKVPTFAVDGKGKMKAGGMTKKGYQAGGKLGSGLTERQKMLMKVKPRATTAKQKAKARAEEAREMLKTGKRKPKQVTPMKKGGMAKKKGYVAGGMIAKGKAAGGASKRADGLATKGKTRGKMI